MSRTNLFEKSVRMDTDTLLPGLRVNYEPGLLMGVNEFRQEQFYFLQKDYLHNRSLHGYGTIYGLKVTAEATGENREAKVTVEPGMAVDRWGRPVVVETQQCAHLGAWLKKNKTPSGEHSLYVLLRYEETQETGLAAASNGQTPSATRIRDNFRLDISLTPPEEKSWEATRTLTQILSKVRISPEIGEDESDEPKIIRQVRTLAQVADPDRTPPPPPGPNESYFFLPAAAARAALDRIFNVWLGEVCPELEPGVTSLTGEKAVPPDILLARLDINWTGDRISLKEDGPLAARPYLLPTELVQELLYAGSSRAPAQRSFATIRVLDRHTVQAWLHYPGSVSTGVNGVSLSADGVNLALEEVRKLPFEFINVFELTTRENIRPGARVELDFRLEALSHNRVSLLKLLNKLDFAYTGREGSHLKVASFAAVAPPRELVSISSHHADTRVLRWLRESEISEELEEEEERSEQGEEENERGLDAFAIPRGTPFLRLWFHTSEPVKLPGTVQVYRGSLLNPYPRRTTTFEAVPLVRDGSEFAYLWALFVPLKPPEAAPTLREDELLTLRLPAQEIQVGNPATTLLDIIRNEGRAFAGYNGSRTVYAHHQVKLPHRPPAAAKKSLDEIHEVVREMPLLPFVTITNLSQSSLGGSLNHPVFELWFHLDHNPAVFNHSFRHGLVYSILVEVGGNPVRLVEFPAERITTAAIRPNVWLVTLDAREWKGTFERSPYLRFVFPLAENRVSQGEGKGILLREYMREHNIRYQGYSRFRLPDGVEREAIVAYARLSGGPRA